MIRPARRLMPCAAGLLAALTGTAAFGQGNIFNPYGNSGYADYREFGSPKYSIDSSLPGEARLQATPNVGRGANQFESYMNSLDGAGGAGDFGSARGSTGLPYYRAQQLYNAQTTRGAGRLNDTPAGRLYQARVAERNAAYQAALAEKDPKKRALMLQRLDQDAIERPLSAITDPAATPRRVGATGSARSGVGSVARSPEYSSPVSRAANARMPARPAPTRPASPPRAATTPAAAAPAPPPAAAAPTTPAPVDPSSVPIPPPR